MDKDLMLRLSQKYDSFYLYDESAIMRAADTLRRDFPQAEFLYSIKANPNPQVLRSILSRGFGADAASLAEVKLAASMGLPPEKIQYSAPGKTERDIAAALPLCTLTADSPAEVRRIQTAAAAAGIKKARTGVRINPGFSFGGGEGRPSKFGVDEETALSLLPEWAAMENVEITGVHVHLRSQSLDAAALEAYWRGMLCLADSFGRTMGRPLEFVNMGSGMGIPFSGPDVPLDTATLGRKVCDMIAAFRAENPDTRVIIETGRFLTGPAGTYVMKVLDKKVSRGRTFVILCNTMNGFLRPAEAHMISFLAPNAPPAEPLFTAADAFTFTALPGDKKPETVTLAGNLCTAADIIAEDISLPGLERGDAVAVPNAGCYAAALSPMGFSSQTPPAELLLGTDGIVRET